MSSNQEEQPEIVLYQYHASYWSQMARMAFAEKGIPFTRVDIDIFKGENYEPAYVAINPACEVPAMTTKGITISGSQNIIDYVDKLAGVSLSETDQMIVDAFRKRCCQLPASEITYGVFSYPDLFGNVKVSERVRQEFTKRVIRGEILQQKIAQYPELASAYQEKLDRVVEVQSKIGDADKVKEAVREFVLFLDNVEDLLRGYGKLNKQDCSQYSGWLFGKTFTNADLVLAVVLARIDLLGLVGMFWGDTDRNFLKAYYGRLQERPSFKKECVTVLADKN